ncbi:RHS repeat-associated core domain-containing protein [Litoribacter populi]|uniref:RHS repeat-associated core domain-containing protein n=1 Tax=Litoribacter populi TaxID=2598460 RepID=UPI001181639A|nr:RHS repeat-associated core domain-containing protein [Litoribacter populi]
MNTYLPGLEQDPMQAMVYHYDQLHRIVEARSLTEYSSGSGFASRSTNPSAYDVDYSYDANGNLLTLNRRNDQASVQDDFEYSYYENSNKLRNIDGSTGSNYTYDEIGNLISDASEGITGIEWNPYGKIRSVNKSDGTKLEFRYDAAGQRIEKKVGDSVQRYVRDASGNPMAIYETDSLTEQSIYGSSRLGIQVAGSEQGYRSLGRKRYELVNHLGNVLAVVTDNIHMDQDSTWAEVINITDYYPFGLAMEERIYQDTSSYRYGFNGKENDLETGTQDYGFRIYNTKIAKFLSVDPLTSKYPELTPFQFASNTPIQAIDLDGLEAYFIHGTTASSEMWSPKLTNFIKEKLTNNRTQDDTFNWNQQEGPTNRNWILNNEKKRQKAANSLVMHIVQFRKDNNITDEEITLIGHSHGGNVAIQAAKILYDKYGVQANIINFNTPAYNKRGDAENPENNSGINELIHYYTKGDIVAGQVAPGSNDKYNYKVNTKIKNIQLTNPHKKGPISSHLMENINLEELKEKGQKPNEVYKGLRNPDEK